MRLTQVLLRKRKMRHKPLSFVRNMLWNNHYYLNQERHVVDLKFKESLLERKINISTIDEILSPIAVPTSNPEPIHIDKSSMRGKALVRDQTHPLWKDEAAYTYRDRTWLPTDYQLNFACAATNTIPVDTITYPQISNSNGSVERVTDILRSVYIGDALQKKLPKNFVVPFTGWHPVESTMNPRNQYDWKQVSWGWNPAREYGVPNPRKLLNLTRGLFKEGCKHHHIEASQFNLLEDSRVRQFIRRPDGKLVRYDLSVPAMITAKQGLNQMSQKVKLEMVNSQVPDMSPVNPVGAYFKEHIYEVQNNFPIKSSKFSHPHIQTVVYHNTSHIKPIYNADKERSKCLVTAYAAALGQARLAQGEEMTDLKQPITINAISTNGKLFTFSRFQLNSLDLESGEPNIFQFDPQTYQLFDFAGYQEGRAEIEGVNMDTYNLIISLMLQGHQNV